MHPQLIIEQKDRLLSVTLNRTEDNGVSDSMASALSQLLGEAHETADAVLLRSAGPDFCTGRVRDAGPTPAAAEAYTRRDEYDGIFGSYQAMRSAKVPIIGVIRGRCMGFGTAIASLCDVSFASDTATFNIPEIGHNVMPTMVMSAVYDRMNRNAILWMAYSTDFIDAHLALKYGLVSQVVPEEKLDGEVQRFANLLLSRPRPAILGLKEYLRVAPRLDEQAAIDYARSLHSMVNTAAAMKKEGALETAMEINGTQSIAAPRQQVWDALNDPEILKKSLPGCESVERVAIDEFKVVMAAAIGPLRARFNGMLKMSDINAPESCTMNFEGQGGAVGFGKGKSSVKLTEADGLTELSYTAEAQVGGKLAQVGSRLIESVARKMANDFFTAFKKQLAGGLEVMKGSVTVVPGSAVKVPGSSAIDASMTKAPMTSTAVSAAQLGPGIAAPVMVPGWWLAISAVIGSVATLAGALLMR